LPVSLADGCAFHFNPAAQWSVHPRSGRCSISERQGASKAWGAVSPRATSRRVLCRRPADATWACGHVHHLLIGRWCCVPPDWVAWGCGFVGPCA